MMICRSLRHCLSLLGSNLTSLHLSLLVANDLFSFLLASYQQYKPPKETDTIGLLIPRWMGAAMVIFNLVYKFEYLKETPFAWLDIYFTKLSSLTSSAAHIPPSNNTTSSPVNANARKAARYGSSSSVLSSAPLLNRKASQSNLGDASDSSADHPESNYSQERDLAQPSLLDKIPHPNYSLGAYTDTLDLLLDI